MFKFGNPANPRIHYLTTGPEIWQQTNGKVDIVVFGVGTGGSLTGIGSFLRSKNPNIKVSIQHSLYKQGNQKTKCLNTSINPIYKKASKKELLLTACLNTVSVLFRSMQLSLTSHRFWAAKKLDHIKSKVKLSNNSGCNHRYLLCPKRKRPLILGIGANFVPEILDTKLYNGIIRVPSDKAIATSKRLAREEGILCGCIPIPVPIYVKQIRGINLSLYEFF